MMKIFSLLLIILINILSYQKAFSQNKPPDDPDSSYLVITSNRDCIVYMDGDSVGVLAKDSAISKWFLYGSHIISVRNYTSGKDLIRDKIYLGSFTEVYFIQIFDSTNSDINIEMVYVEGGTFKMGRCKRRGMCKKDSRPVHKVTLDDFYIGKFEITQDQWTKVMGANPSNFMGCGNCPVENVTNYGTYKYKDHYNDVNEFIYKLNKMTGKNYRLPTEAEWEYAARGGNKSKNYLFSGSDNIDDVAWHEGNSFRRTYPVGLKNPNELGIYDMTGNVWEWCSDWFGKYNKKNSINPRGPNSNPDLAKVERGGSFMFPAKVSCVGFRDCTYQGVPAVDIGFRVVLPKP